MTTRSGTSCSYGSRIPGKSDTAGHGAQEGSPWCAGVTAGNWCYATTARIPVTRKRGRGAWGRQMVMATAAAGALSAGAAVPSEPSATGVLVAVADRQMGLDVYGAEPQKITSYWVDTSASPTAKPAEIAGLVIPTRGGFRRFIVRRKCTPIPDLQPHFQGMDTQNCDDTLVERPLASAAIRPTAPRRKDDVDPPCAFDKVVVTFASPAVISLEAHSGNSEACEPRGYHWSERAWVRRLDDPAMVSFSSLLGRAARDAYAEAGSAAFRSWRSWQEREDACSPPVPEEDTGWCIRRIKGRWTPVLKQQLGLAFCEMDAPIRGALPPRVVGFREPTRPWSVTRKLFPKATGVHVSPDGQWLVVTMPNRIVVASAKGDTVASLPSGAVVLVQWALNRHVAEWRKALTH